MSAPSAKVAESARATRAYELSPEVERELRDAIAEIDRGEYIDLTPAQLQAWAETGELPWLDESRD